MNDSTASRPSRPLSGDIPAGAVFVPVGGQVRCPGKLRGGERCNKGFGVVGAGPYGRGIWLWVSSPRCDGRICTRCPRCGALWTFRDAEA